MGEHFGRLTSFPLGVRYDGGSVREPSIGTLPLTEGLVFHQTALYELIYLLVLFVVLTWLLHLRKQRGGPGVAMAVFCGCYGVARFASDSLRVNDERVLGLTGAQFLCLALVPASAVDLVPGPQARSPPTLARTGCRSASTSGGAESTARLGATVERTRWVTP